MEPPAQAGAINAMSWIGIAIGGLLWPVAFIWAFTTPFGVKSAKNDPQSRGVEPDTGDGIASALTGEGGATVIAILIIVYVAIVLVLFKVLHLKPSAI